MTEVKYSKSVKLTEDCDDEFYNQPYEVEKKEKTVTVNVVEYVKKG